MTIRVPGRIAPIVPIPAGIEDGSPALLAGLGKRPVRAGCTMATMRPTPRKSRESVPTLAPPGAVALRKLAHLIARHAPRDGVFPLRLPGTYALRRGRISSEPVYATMGPSLCIVAQGAKVMMLGSDVVEYDAARLLLFAVDLPVSGHVTRASWRDPFLGFKLDLVPARVAELAARVYPQGVPKASDHRGLYVGQATDAIIDAVTRLLDADGPGGGRGPPRAAGGRRDPDSLAAHSDWDSSGPDRRTEVRSPSHRQGGRLDTRAFRATRHRRGDGGGDSHERVVVPPALQGGDHAEPASIPEGAPAARSPAADAVPGDGRERRVPPRRLPERFAVQPGVRPLLRKCA